MDLSAISALKLLNSSELTKFSETRTISPIYRLQVAQILACDHEDFEDSGELQEAVTTALSDFIKELASSFDGDAEHNEALIVQNLVDEFFDRRQELFDGYFYPWPCEEQSSSRPTWKWPVVLQPEEPGKTKVQPFAHQYSALKMFGYTVGRTKGWPQERRRSFLSDFMTMDLPDIVERTFGCRYGGPLSVTRLQEVASLISALCSLAQRRDPIINEEAIRDWKEDLEFLRITFYEGHDLKFVPWPRIRL